MPARKGVFDKDALYSTVINTSGVARRFGFLPPHGVKLAINEEYTVFGDIRDVIRSGLDPAGSRRRIRAFCKALDRRDLNIVSTPAQVMKDTVTGANKIMRLASAVLTQVDPAWEATSDAAEKIPA